MTAKSVLVFWVCVTLGNFLYVLFPMGGTWAKATERSFFQGAALFGFWVLQVVTRR